MKKEFTIKYKGKNLPKILEYITKNIEDIKDNRSVLNINKLLESITSSEFLEISGINGSSLNSEEKKSILNIVQKSIHFLKKENQTVSDLYSYILYEYKRTEVPKEKRMANIWEMINEYIHELFNVHGIEYRMYSKEDRSSSSVQYTFETRLPSQKNQSMSVLKYISEDVSRLVYIKTYLDLIEGNSFLYEDPKSIDIFSFDELYTKSTTEGESVPLIECGLESIYKKKAEFTRLLVDAKEALKNTWPPFNPKPSEYRITSDLLKIFLSFIFHKDKIVKGLNAYCNASTLVKKIVPVLDTLDIDRTDILESLCTNYTSVADQIAKMSKQSTETGDKLVSERTEGPNQKKNTILSKPQVQNIPHKPVIDELVPEQKAYIEKRLNQIISISEDRPITNEIPSKPEITTKILSPNKTLKQDRPVVPNRTLSNSVNTPNGLHKQDKPVINTQTPRKHFNLVNEILKQDKPVPVSVPMANSLYKHAEKSTLFTSANQTAHHSHNGANQTAQPVHTSAPPKPDTPKRSNSVLIVCLAICVLCLVISSLLFFLKYHAPLQA